MTDNFLRLTEKLQSKSMRLSFTVEIPELSYLWQSWLRSSLLWKTSRKSMLGASLLWGYLVTELVRSRPPQRQLLSELSQSRPPVEKILTDLAHSTPSMGEFLLETALSSPTLWQELAAEAQSRTIFVHLLTELVNKPNLGQILTQLAQSRPHWETFWHNWLRAGLPWDYFWQCCLRAGSCETTLIRSVAEQLYFGTTIDSDGSDQVFSWTPPNRAGSASLLWDIFWQSWLRASLILVLFCPSWLKAVLLCDNFWQNWLRAGPSWECFESAGSEQAAYVTTLDRAEQLYFGTKLYSLPWLRTGLRLDNS